MTKVADRYTYRVTWSEDDKEYVGMCVEFPGLSWLDQSPDAALSGIRQVVKDCLADMASENEAIPEPIATKKFSGKLMLRVPPEVHRMLAMKAAESGVSLNRYISSKLQ